MRGGPPLPIPNREVKPRSADDTALSCGKVGRRHPYNESLGTHPGLFCFYIPSFNPSAKYIGYPRNYTNLNETFKRYYPRNYTNLNETFKRYYPRNYTNLNETFKRCYPRNYTNPNETFKRYYPRNYTNPNETFKRCYPRN